MRQLAKQGQLQTIIATPKNQKEDLIDAAAAHATDKHDHTNDERLHTDLADLIETVQIQPLPA